MEKLMIGWDETMPKGNLGSLLKAELIDNLEKTKLCSMGQLPQILAYMKMKNLITHETYESLILTLPARGRTIVAEYADGTVKYNREMDDIIEEYEQNTDIFNPVCYLKWFVGRLYRDENMRNRCQFHSFSELVSNLDRFRLPEWTRGFFPGSNGIAGNAVLTEQYLFYLVRNKFGSYELRRQPVPAYFRAWEPTRGRIIREGLGNRLIYNESKSIIYCSLNHIYAYYQYDLKDGSSNIIYNRHIIGIAKDGREVYYHKGADGEWEVCVQVSGKEKVLERGESSLNSKLEGDRVLISSSYGAPALKIPYWIDLKGNIVSCGKKKCARVFWDYLLIYDLERMKRFISVKISDTLLLAEGEKAPDELTLKKLLNSLENAVKNGVLQKSRWQTFKQIITLLENKGIDRDEDCTEILFTLLKYSRLCQKNFFKKGYWDSTFYSLLLPLAERDNFYNLLYHAPEKLFGDYIYWTKQKDQERESLLQKKGVWGRIDEGKIGYFDLRGRRLIYDAKPISEGTVFGNEIKIQNTYNYRGEVSYDLVGQRYLISWPAEVDICDKVKRAFRIKEEQCVLRQ